VSGAPALALAAGKEGPAILLIHGFGADRLIWTANVRALGAIGRVYALDLPGHGETAFDGAGDLASLTRSVAGAVDVAGIGPVHIVAHSLGGAIAVALAATRPDLVRSLALIASAGLGGPADAPFLAEFPESATLERTEALLQRLVSRPRLINRQMVAGALQKLGAPGVREGYRAIAAGLRNVNAALEPYLRDVARSNIPRLAIWGSADLIIPHDPDRLAAFGADVFVLPEAAHLPHVENAREVNERLVLWIGGQTP
jgi:pimeloyl-ACP methyl ester carboxylesterase